jgi:cell division initiation protein
MGVTPQDIQNKEFRESFRGYHEDDVDGFLDEVAEEYARLYHENQRMKVQLAALQQEVARVGEARERPAPAAPAARDDDAHVEAARKAAEAALEEAKRRAQDVVQRAEARAREIDELTARRAKDVDADASAALTDAQQRVQDLRRQEVELRRRIRTFLEQQLAALEAVDLDAPAAPRQPDPPRSPVVERMTRELADPAPAPRAATPRDRFWAGE